MPPDSPDNPRPLFSNNEWQPCRQVAGVRTFFWNPRAKYLPIRGFHRVRYGPLTNNFGDLLGPILVAALHKDRELGKAEKPVSTRRLLTVGSILHLSRNGDVVWGSGINGSVPIELKPHSSVRLDIRSVRGPLTRKALLAKGHDVPEVYGDPALLLPRFHKITPDYSQCRSTVLVPNLHDTQNIPDRYAELVAHPQSHIADIVSRIATARLVVSSSLHGIVLAEAYGVPAVWVNRGHEADFKYHDYFAGTDREDVSRTSSWENGVRTERTLPPLKMDDSGLFEAFPHDLWRPSTHRQAKTDE